MTSSQRWRIGFDIGGTFTDFILYDGENGSVLLHKRLTTPNDPSEAALIGLEELVAMGGVTLADVGEIVHGTTLVTNVIIERKGAKLGLVTTEGFRDILEIGTEQRYDIYDLFLQFPEPLVSRDLRLEVCERIDRDGNAIAKLDADDVRRVLRRLVDAGCDAVAVCFINAYRNPAHELLVENIARDEFPELFVSLSSKVVAEIGEYQRCVTASANAYVQPMMHRYLTRLERELSARGFSGDLRLMHSAGGLVSPATAREYPIRLLESGPAGGGLATALFGALAGKKDVISFDMGGTTAKACMIEDGRAEIAPMIEASRVHRFTKGSGLPIKAPVIDMIEIGAGGGSVAVIDEVGLLKVGPHSAGADPGPACYGMGGTEPTVTDANLALGYYDPGFFLGGRMKLDVEAARRAIKTVADPLGLSIEDAAWGIHTIVTESMAAAARVHLVEKGKDPRRYSMVGFGGAGPAHAADVARVMGVSEVIIPPASGAASALGFLAAPLSFETARSLPVEFSNNFDAGLINRTLTEMEQEGSRRLIEAGVPEKDIRFERSADMRLVGQMHYILVDLPAEEISTERLGDIRAAFVAAYTKRYTTVDDSARMEAINFRVRCVGPTPELALTGATGGGDAGAKVKGTRRAWFEGGWAEAKVYDRYALRTGDSFSGPAIIEEREATTVVAPGDRVSIDDSLNLRVAVAVAADHAVVVKPDMPIEEAKKVIESDPIALEIMWSRLVNVVEEMWHTVCRTAYSLVISEAQDFGCELLDPEGNPLAHSPRAMPVFNLTLPRAVKALIERYPSHTLKPGDVLMTNDPWLCAGHLFDLAIVTPAFFNGRVVGLMGTVGHVSDIGGTRDWPAARELYEEGLQIPPMKIYEEGRPNETFFRLFAENVRNSDQVIGDVQSMISANATGAERLVSFMRDYGMQDLRALAAVVQGRSEKAMRDAIRAIPDGVYHSEISIIPRGAKLDFPLKLTITGDEIELDFGAPPQLPRGGLNCTLNYATAHATYPLKCMLTPGVRGNAGCYRPFTFKAPAGSMLNAAKPASVNLRTRTGWYLGPNIFRALSQAAPAKVQAFTGIPVSCNVYGQLADGTIYSDLLLNGGGQGGSQKKDGKSALLFPNSAANTSIEMFESRVPALVLEKSLMMDSGGPGRHRGGLGTRVRVRKLKNDGLTMLIAVDPESADNPMNGLFGGHPGPNGRGSVRDLEGRELRRIGTGELVELTTADHIIDLMLAGGSGYGDPLERRRDLVARDVAQGYVSAEGARRDYGAVVAEEPEAAHAAG